MKSKFNLIDEPWLPIAGVGRVSLAQLFSNSSYDMLAGNPIQQVALMKFLLAISQVASMPDDEEAWLHLSDSDMAERCLSYLRKWHHKFYLYGEDPFLQMPAIDQAACKSFGVACPETSTGNATLLYQSQCERELDDADKALLLLVQMGFALGGKKTDNSVVLSPGYTGKRKGSTGRYGPSMGYIGFLHSFVLGENLWGTLRLNLLTKQDIETAPWYPSGLGVAPWEDMPHGECCATAKRLQTSLMGRLIPLSRFCLLAENGFHYSEGIAYPDYKDGGVDPSIALNRKTQKVLWVNPARRPWRDLPELLGFLGNEQIGFECLQLRCGVGRALKQPGRFAIWSGGLRASGNTLGEQKTTMGDDYVESIIWLPTEGLTQEWLSNLKTEMNVIEALGQQLQRSVNGYYSDLKADGKSKGSRSTSLFWELCGREAQRLVDYCEPRDAYHTVRYQMREYFTEIFYHAFDAHCPRVSARQLESWAKNRPNIIAHAQQEDL